MIFTRSEEEIARIRKGGRILVQIFREIKKFIRPGINTADIDKIAEESIEKLGAVPAFIGYRGYKYATCISVNDEVVHGIPGRRRLEQGDLVGVDIGARVEGFYADMAVTFPVGEISKKARRLLVVTKQALTAAIKQARAGNHLGDIGAAVESTAKQAGYSVVRDLFGHGVGEKLHEDPLIPNYGNRGEGLELKPGMVFAIEPMLNSGTHEIRTLDDGWTIVTADGGLSAHFEHTVVVRDKNAEILTHA